MRVPRVFVDAELTTGNEIVLPPAAAHHVLRVLRGRSGDPVILFNGQGGEFKGQIIQCTKSTVVVGLSDFISRDAESTLSITLAQGISRGERMDFTIQKAVELGVTRIVPLQTLRSTVQLDRERADKRLQHWRGVVVSACEQCGRNRLPEVLPVQALESWLDSSRPSFGLLCIPDGKSTLSQIVPPDNNICLLVGPEGGLDEREIAAALHAGFIPIELGPRVLRTETAPLVAITAVQTLWGDLARRDTARETSV